MNNNKRTICYLAGLIILGVLVLTILFILACPMIFLPIGGANDVPMEIQTQRFLNS